MTPSIEDLQAADDFRKTVLDRADGKLGTWPWWHGWVITDAYLAGLKAGREEIFKAKNVLCNGSNDELATAKAHVPV